jgi:hypothetical protein
VAGATTAAGTPGTGRTTTPHPAAGNALISTTLEAKHGHHPMHIGGITFWAVHGFITSEDQSLKLLTTFTAFVFEDGHSFFLRCNPTFNPPQNERGNTKWRLAATLGQFPAPSRSFLTFTV